MAIYKVSEKRARYIEHGGVVEKFPMCSCLQRVFIEAPQYIPTTLVGSRKL